MTFTQVAAFFSTLLGIYCSIPYIRAILAGRTKPHQLSWLVFVIMNGIVLFSQYFSGARGSALISLTFFVGSAIILLLSLKYGTRDTSRWDRALFLFALLTIVIWYFTKNNSLAIWLTLLIDLAATSMIILKIRAEPNSEDPKPWILASSAYIFSCLTLLGQPLSILYVRPLYGLIGDVALVGFIFYVRRGSKPQSQTSPLEV